jgi:hypothetical protein
MANVFQHLQVLKSSNLVKVRRSGKPLYYIIAEEQTASFFTVFKDFAHKRFAEIQIALNEILESPTRLKPVDMDELKRKVFEEEALIIDVRPEEAGSVYFETRQLKYWYQKVSMREGRMTG